MNFYQRKSLYWDDFERRVEETVFAIKNGSTPPVRRVAVFITDRCNFKCKYCNHRDNGRTLPEAMFMAVLEKYGETAIIHITGGEPSVVPWLYPILKKHGGKYRFHLNTNAFIKPPAESVRRLKISLDHYNGASWNCLVGRNNAFKIVTDNIKDAIKKTIVSLTYTLTKQNYQNAPEFARFANDEMPGLYAIFFSVYKGDNPNFAFTDADVNLFFDSVLPAIESKLSGESLALVHETIDEKKRLIQGVRFPENNKTKQCFLSMSERVISPDGNEYTCSHLYRDGILTQEPIKNKKCLYGCNRRLSMFNAHVEQGLRGI